MKRGDLVRPLESRGCVLVRRGVKHDWYQNMATKVSQPIPRHREIADTLAKHILKMLGCRASPDRPRRLGLQRVFGRLEM